MKVYALSSYEGIGHTIGVYSTLEKARQFADFADRDNGWEKSWDRVQIHAFHVDDPADLLTLDLREVDEE